MTDDANPRTQTPVDVEELLRLVRRLNEENVNDSLLTEVCEFIRNAAPSLLPALLAEVVRLRERVRELEAKR